jgi:hypothetical protein
VEEFKYLGTNLTNQNSIQEEVKSRFYLEITFKRIRLSVRPYVCLSASKLAWIFFSPERYFANSIGVSGPVQSALRK